MATLNLQAVWINRMSTGQGVGLCSLSDRIQEFNVAGAVRTYAGGRQRAITGLGTIGKYTVTLVLATPAQLDTMRQWIGVTLELRDHAGQRFFGSYLDIQTTENKSPVSYNIKFDFLAVTMTDAV